MNIEMKLNWAQLLAPFLLFILVSAVLACNKYVHVLVDSRLNMQVESFIKEKPAMVSRDVDSNEGVAESDAEEFGNGFFAFKASATVRGRSLSTNHLVCITTNHSIKNGDRVTMKFWRAPHGVGQDLSIPNLPIATKSE